MKKKQFKAESQKLLDLMINSIYTNKEIFMRELISNASDAIDKIYYKSLTDDKIKIKKDDLAIWIKSDKKAKTITISDNGCGMTAEELENNLGTIARSGSGIFKEENKSDDVSIIGQFGVGFYSAFMTSSKVAVTSRPYGSDDAYTWESDGKEGYSIVKSSRSDYGTDIVLTIKDDDEEYKYQEFLEEYRIREIIKRYSNYIRYPIKMMCVKHELKEGTKDEYIDSEEETILNSMTPIWKKDKKDVKDDDYNAFYASTFYDYDKPLHMIKSKVEGQTSYNSLLFIPSHAPYDLYTKEYQKGLQLYSNGVMIMEHCADLLPDYFGFVKGIVDSDDLPLNISREILQQNRIVDLISKNIEKKITSELTNMLDKDRKKYEEFFKVFGLSLKMGIYSTYGACKEQLQDLIMFYSSTKKEMITFKEYVDNMKKDQDVIYYAVGDTNSKIDMMPQVEAIKDKEYEILYLTEATDEFVIQMMNDYNGKKFKSVADASVDTATEDEKKELSDITEKSKDVLSTIKDTLKDNVTDVKFTTTLKNHPVCLTTEGAISSGMEKVLNNMPNSENVKAKEVLMINAKHPIVNKLEKLLKTDKEEFNKYAKILYSEARLIEGLEIENPSEISDLIMELLAK